MPTIDETFVALPLHALADAALSRAQQLGATHADVRIQQEKFSARTLRDSVLSSVVDNVDLALSVRLVFDGSWGFAAGTVLTPEAAVELVDRAVTLAKISKPLLSRAVELAPEPVYTDATWISEYEINPFDVAEDVRLGRLRQLSDVMAASPGVTHTNATVKWTQENKFFASLDGSRILQQKIMTVPSYAAIHVGEGFHTMRSVCPPAGRGWEYLADNKGWDFDAEAAQIPEYLAEFVQAPQQPAGKLDLVIEPSNLWLTIHESIAHATELDRALGYEAAYAGSSFATFDQLGSLQYGSSMLNVTGDRDTPHGLASIGYDDEGVAAQTFDIVKDGVLAGFQTNRQMAAEKGLGRSNGCAFADSGLHIPMQRMPNVSVAADPNGGSTQDLIAAVDDGLLVVGDNSWSIDMQRYNFQFTAQRYFRIKNGRLAGQVRDCAYQATTTDFWRSLDGLGGPKTWQLFGADNCGKAQPGQSAPVSHGSPSALFRGVNVIPTAGEDA